MFMVGDVKQSIYRFRQAMPKLFLDKYSNYKPVETDPNCSGRKIQLFKNFRSRDNVLDFTNLIFKDIMSEKLGEVDYNEDEYLNFGAEDYKKINQNLKTEIDIIDVKIAEENGEDSQEFSNKYYENSDYGDDDDEKEDELEHLENIEIEAKYVANKIKKLIDSKYQVYDRKKETFRDITYKDIAILLRSTKDKASIYEQELIKLDMPVFADSNQEYLDSIEIQTIMSLLKIIDNPMQDIPLVTVLRSNIGKFTDNELVEIRLSDKYDNFYNCMQKAKVDVNAQLKEKIENFLNQIDTWRKEQEYLALDELIWKIYSDTGYYNYVGLMPNGNLRQANLKMLFERAKKYETASFKGLYNFINFIEKLKINSGDLSSAKIIGENDDVIGTGRLPLPRWENGKNCGTEEKSGLARLLEMISALPGNFAVRPLYIHPDHFNRDILPVMRKDKRLLPYFDIPFQSGSENIIHKMNRKGSAAEYLRLASDIREALPGASLRTTFLTGFPGETDADAAETVEFLKKLKSDWSGCFPYSREEDTPAYSMKNRVKADVAKRRAGELVSVQAEITRQSLAARVGGEYDVLIEEIVEGDEGLAIGRAWFQAPEVDGSVVVRYEKDSEGQRELVKTGRFVKVRVVASSDVDLDAILSGDSELNAGVAEQKKEGLIYATEIRD